jgi:coatomer protein complex subunit gamma
MTSASQQIVGKKGFSRFGDEEQRNSIAMSIVQKSTFFTNIFFFFFFFLIFFFFFFSPRCLARPVDVVPFANLDKGLVLQERRIFGEAKPNVRACCHLLTKILYLVAQGEPFTKKEATDTFFAVTKLFQSKDVQLRRMVYLALRELAPLAEQDHIIIVIASLTKDMNDSNEIYRANAIRVLCRIIDPSMLAQVERYLKQAIVVKEAYVASAAIVSGLHLIRVSPDIVKRWVNEVQQALSSRFVMVQYHALGLLYQIKRHDRLAVAKLVQSMTRGAIRSPYAHCLLIRFAARSMRDDRGGDQRAFFDYLESCLRHKSEIVIYEAARAICELPDVKTRELTPAITVLQLFLSSSKATLRFAAVRTLSRVAQTHPLSVTPCNLDLENLITDTNRSIATLAITTLLKTGSAASVERLMKQITSFMSEITDEFKVVVVDAIRALALKFPEKHRALMTFLAGALRDEGGFQFKRAIVDAILDIIKSIPESKDAGLTHLCEFIEDCEFASLSTKILNLLGAEGPSTQTPSKFIRYIYNRISLENAAVRAAAVSALARFGAALPVLRGSVCVLLRRCIEDNDDEVRDRAAAYLRTLEAPSDDAARAARIAATLPTNATSLEAKLLAYVRDAGAVAGGRFNLAAALEEIKTEAAAAPVAGGAGAAGAAGGAVASTSAGGAAGGAAGSGLLGLTRAGVADTASSHQRYAAELAEVPALFEVGTLFGSSKSVPLTEAETEYVVSLVKHVFPNHLVLQFNCNNTLSDQMLKRVRVHVEPVDDTTSEKLKLERDVPLAALPYSRDGVTYVVFRIVEGAASAPTATFKATLKFGTVDVDANATPAQLAALAAATDEEDGAVEDEYELEEFAVLTADYVRPVFVSNFAEDWDGVGEGGEAVETYALASIANLSDAVVEVTRYLGMQAAEGSDQVKAGSKKHILYLAGRFVGDVPVLVRVRMRLAKEGAPGVNMEVTVRSPNADVSASLARAIG